MRYLFSIIYLIVFVFSIPQLSLKKKDIVQRTNEVSLLTEAKQTFDKDISGLKDACHQLIINAEKFDANTSPFYYSKLKSSILSARQAYKKIEFLVAYLDPQLDKTMLNGAPLPKLEPHVPEVRVIEPSGLQMLDELICLDTLEAFTNSKKIIELSYQLKNSLHPGLTILSQKPFQHRFIFEGARMEMIRLYSMGLTGFDTPGSANAIPEAISSLQAMKVYFEFYQNQYSNHSLSNITFTLKQLIDYLKNPKINFDNLDRLFVLTQFINPLFQSIYLSQKELGIEFHDEVEPMPTGINFRSENIFDLSTFNLSYYTNIPEAYLSDKNKSKLGELLFFDPVLSSNLKTSCASCHNPKKGFTDGEVKSVNSYNEAVLRNAPSIINAALATEFFYDMREYELERQIKHVVFDKSEFDTDFFEIMEKLSTSSEYKELFNEAYPTYGLSVYSIGNALACFVASKTAYNSSFDKYVRGETIEIDSSIKKGHNLFMGTAGCGTCHFAPTFSGLVPPLYDENESEVLGVPVSYDTTFATLDPDGGRYMNGKPGDEARHLLFSFKTPTIRNAQITAPYMHNGSLTNLEEVLDFYNRGGGSGIGIELENQTLPSAPLGLTKAEQLDIIAFMNALTDTTGLTSIPKQLPRFENKPEWDLR